MSSTVNLCIHPSIHPWPTPADLLSFSPSVQCQRTTPFVVSVMTTMLTRSCCPPVNAQGLWPPSTAAAWSTGCLLQEPASVSFATTSLLYRGSPGLCLRYTSIRVLPKINMIQSFTLESPNEFDCCWRCSGCRTRVSVRRSAPCLATWCVSCSSPHWPPSLGGSAFVVP